MLNTIFEILATVIDFVFLTWFVPKFNRTSVLEKKWTLIFPLASLMLQFAVDYIHGNLEFIFIIIQFAFFFLFSLFLCDGKYTRAILSACLFALTLITVGSVIVHVFSYAYPWVEFVLVSYEGKERIIFLIICKTIQFIVYKILLQIFKAEDNLDTRSSIWCILFTLLTCVVLTTLVSLCVEFRDEKMQTYAFIIAIAVVITNVVFYFLIYHIQKLLKLKYELKLTKERMAFETEKMEEAHIIWDNIKKLRHDIKNHIIVISAQLDRGMVDECREYVKKLEPSVDSMGDLIRSNNEIADYIINSKLSKLDDIEVFIVGTLGNLEKVEDTDIACIMGNIIDNAVEAQNKVRGEKKIELVFSRVGGGVSIVCKNTIEKSVLSNNSDLKTSKNDKDSHGMGHKIVENAVKKYGGMIEYFEEENIFGVQIFLPKISDTKTSDSSN